MTITIKSSIQFDFSLFYKRQYKLICKEANNWILEVLKYAK